jgi:hypothetical protein
MHCRYKEKHLLYISYTVLYVRAYCSGERQRGNTLLEKNVHVQKMIAWQVCLL